MSYEFVENGISLKYIHSKALDFTKQKLTMTVGNICIKIYPGSVVFSIFYTVSVLSPVYNPGGI